ncbi:MAG: transcription termination factor NusA [Ktedonobacterales bacterium]
MRTEFQTAIAQLIHEKGLPQEKVMEAVANALLAAYRKGVGGGENIRIEVERNGDVRVWASKRVVAQAHDSGQEISLADAQLIDPHAALGQSIEVDSPQIFNKIPTQTAKQIILQRIREAEMEHLFESYKDQLDDMVVGVVLRREDRSSNSPSGYLLDLGKIEGFLDDKEQLPNERLKPNQRVRVYVYDLKRGSGRGVQALVSRTHRNIIKRLFELEVPEIFDGNVEIKAIAREPGSRSKVAVWARQENIDPIGACVGVRGARINNIINELNGEKIDIIQWDPDPAQFVANALSPVKPLNVELRESDHTALVTVPERQLSLAIGKVGQNARLAAKLTGWRIDVSSPAPEVTEAAVAAETPERVEAHEQPAIQESDASQQAG